MKSTEDLLRQLPPPTLPPAWRDDILAAAGQRSPGPRARAIERTLWTAVAAAWLVILALRIDTPALPEPTGPAISAADFADHWHRTRQLAETGTLPAPPIHRLELEATITLPPRS